MLLFSNEDGLLEVLSVLGLQFHQVGDFLSELGSSGEQEIVKEILGSVDIDGGVLDVLFQLNDVGVVLASSLVKVEL
jgi:hypothetical protein